jgi:hypothetical protein
MIKFGCICFAHVPNQIRNLGKLDETGVRCRFIGFDEANQRQGYKLLREHDLKIIYSSDVTFFENIEMTKVIEKDESYSELYVPRNINQELNINQETNINQELDDDDIGH